MSAAEIHATSLNDIPGLITFINSSWVRTYAPLIGQEVARDLATTKHTSTLFEREIGANDALSFVAFDGAPTIVGHVGGFKKGEGAIYIDRFHVAPDWHGKGISTPLMEAAAAHAKFKGFQRLELTVLEGNDRAMAFYVKVGFVQDHEQSLVEGMGGKQAVPLMRKL